MATKRARSSHWLDQQWWRFALAEWIGLILGFLVVVLIFCVSDPVPIAGNKLELLANGDEYFPAI